MKTNLYNIELDYLRLVDEIEANDGVLTEEQEKALTINESELKGKALAYKEVIATKEIFNQRIDDEIKRLQALKKTNNNVVARLKERLLEAVKLFGNFEANLSKFGTRKSTQVLTPEDINGLPKEYKTVKVTEAANKVAIKEALKAGKTIEGCELKEVLTLKID